MSSRASQPPRTPGDQEDQALQVATGLLAPNAQWRTSLTQAFSDMSRELQVMEEKERRNRFRPYRERLESSSAKELSEFEAALNEELECINLSLSETYDKRVESALADLNQLLGDERLGAAGGSPLTKGAWADQLDPADTGGVSEVGRNLVPSLIGAIGSATTVHGAARLAQPAMGAAVTHRWASAAAHGARSTPTWESLAKGAARGPALLALTVATATMAHSYFSGRRRAAQRHALFVLDRAGMVSQEVILGSYLRAAADLHSTTLTAVGDAALGQVQAILQSAENGDIGSVEE